MEEKTFVNHGIILENRKQISISGVSECVNFDEETIILHTKLGKLTIKGSNLHIQNFDTNSGDFTAEGKIHALAYTTNEKPGSMLGKIFR